MREKENENMARVKSQKSQKRRKAFVRFLPIYILMLPGLIYLFINNYMPLPGLVIAFKQYNAGKGIYGSPWVGLKNFEYLFTTSDAFVITRNTILYNVAFIVINTTLAIAVAIILSELEGKRKKVYQSAMYSTTNTIDTYVYRGLLQMGNVSMSAAAGVYQSIVGFILVLGANLLVRKIDRDSALI